MYFAFDPHDTATLAPSLRQAFNSNIEISAQTSNGYCLALMDCAFDHGRRPLRWAAESVPVYRTTGRLAALSEVSPKLLVLSKPDSPEFEIEIRRLSRHCNARPMLSFLHSQVSAEELSEQWQKCLMLKTQDDSEPYLLRLADTRVLPGLATLPGTALWQALSQAVNQWVIIERTGMIQALNLAKPVPSPSSDDGNRDGDAADMAITDKDLHHLLACCQADSVINAMEEQFPDLLPKSGHAKFYDHVAQACTLAEQHGIDAFPDVMALAMASHLTQGQVLRNLHLLQRLQQHQWQNGQLSEALSKYLSEEVP